MSWKKSFRQFIETTGDVGNVGSERFNLGARDAYELYSYIWDTLRFRKGGIWSLWRQMPPQTLAEMADDWAEANPQLAHLRQCFWSPDLVRELGFYFDTDQVVHLPD